MVESTVYTGRHGNVLIKQETAWGTVGTGSYLDLGLVQNLSPTSNNTLSRQHTVGSRDTKQINTGNWEGGGSIELLLQHGRPLYYLLGADSMANSGSDYKHTLTQGTTLPSFTLYEGQDSTTDNLQTWAGCKFNTGTLSLALGGMLTFRGDFITKLVTSATTTPSTWTHSTIPTFPHWMASVNIGAAVAYVQNFDITISNAIEKLFSCGHRRPQDAADNQATYDFRFRAGFHQNTEWEQFLGASTPNDTSNPTAITTLFDITNGTAYGSGERRFYITLNGGQINTVGRAVPLNGWVFQDFAGWATGLGTTYVTDTNTTDYDDETS